MSAVTKRPLLWIHRTKYWDHHWVRLCTILCALRRQKLIFFRTLLYYYYNYEECMAVQKLWKFSVLTKAPKSHVGSVFIVQIFS